MNKRQHEILVSLPEALNIGFNELFPNKSGWFTASDPSGSKLGSGGGTAYLLAECWRKKNPDISFTDWLRSSTKLIVHGGGQSRRLPAYSPVGKPFIPIPVSRNSIGESLRQTLIDVQLPDYLHIIDHVPDNIVAMVTSGDVLLKFGRDIPDIQPADVIAMGMTVSPQQAESFGVFFTQLSGAHDVEFFLQKPASSEIERLSKEYDFLVDTGIWLLSEDAVMTLMSKCGWDKSGEKFIDGHPDKYELYSGFGLSLGDHPFEEDPAIMRLKSNVVSLPSPEFYHLGTSRQLIESMTAIQNRGMASGWNPNIHPDQFILNTPSRISARSNANHTLWIENSALNESWNIKNQHVITGVPVNSWKVSLDEGICLDFVPVYDDKFCIRFYHIDDEFRGDIRDKSTRFMGDAITCWFDKRGLPHDAIESEDIISARIFPVLEYKEITDDFIGWLISSEPAIDPTLAEIYLHCEKMSSEILRAKTNVKRLFGQQSKYRQSAISHLYKNAETSIFSKLDLKDTADTISETDDIVDFSAKAVNPLKSVHINMFHAYFSRNQGVAKWKDYENQAFKELRESIISAVSTPVSVPVCSIQQDQIVWGRSPVRIDLAGGWTDTPPYCIEHGGKVVNLACNLNGQPPIQVFVKLNKKMEIIIRSIDMGVDQRITDYKDIRSYAQPGSEFALAKAALAITGFLPEFHTGPQFSDLERQLNGFGGGIEISLLSAVPAGSGLGTSSILAAAILGALNELCGSGWSKHDIAMRTLALEQMLTTGGGWQDQVGGIFPGIKLSETVPGIIQNPTLKWLPDMMFRSRSSQDVSMLYYTGLTRMAKNILQDIVRGMFLNSRRQLSILEEISDHAIETYECIQKNNWESYCGSISRCWELKQELDSGTNPPQVASIIDSVSDYLSCAALPGAGGGGYIYMIAKDEDAAHRVQKQLLNSPPNKLARFVELDISDTGLEITKS